MRKFAFVVIALIVAVIFLYVETGYCKTLKQKKKTSPAPQKSLAKPVDTDKDGKADVWYYSKDKKTYKVEVDSDKDGKPDVTHQREPDGKDAILIDTDKDGRANLLITGKNGKFESAVVDDNKDGKFDKIISNAVDFKKWVNAQDPKIRDGLDKLRAAEKGNSTILFEF